MRKRINKIKTHAIKTIVLTFSLLLFLSACGTLGTENIATEDTHTTTVAPTTAEITTEEIVESTEQAEAFSYQIKYGGAIDYKDRDKYFTLFTSPEDIDKLDGVSQEIKEKYDEKWFETHSFVFLWVGHGSCCFADVNQVQFEDGCLTVSINIVKTNQEDLYKEKGKDYQLGEGGNHHDEAAVSSSFIIEFGKNGEEMLGLLEKLIYKVRDWPSRDDVYVGELRLREPEPPVLELELAEIPFIANYRWTEKGIYRFVNECLYGNEKWEDKMLVSSGISQLMLCLRATKSEELTGKREFFETWDNAYIYTMFSLKPSYDCEVKKVSLEDETLRVYADVVHKQWEQLTEVEQAAIKSGKVGFLDETDENKYEMYIAIDSEYTKEYLELMRAVKNGVLVLRDVMSDETMEVDLEFFSLIDKEYLPY